jgi:hypothetical protein
LKGLFLPLPPPLTPFIVLLAMYPEKRG